MGGLITDIQPQIAAPLSALETNFGVLHLDHVDQGFRLPPGTLAGTDEANAQLLIHYGVYEQLRYSPGLGWLTYNCNEGRWVLDRDLVRAPEIAGRVLRQGVKAYTERLLMSSATKENFTVAKGWQKMVGTLKSIHNALDAVKGKPKFLTDPRLWDADPFALNCLNGVLDLRTGTLRPHSATDMMIRQAEAVYDPEAFHVNVEKLIQLLHADGRHDFLNRLLGSGLCGIAPNEVLTVLLGTGGAGKGTLLGAVLAVLGDYAAPIDVALLLMGTVQDSGTGPKPEILQLNGARLVVAGEPPKNRQFHAGRVKSWTGNDPITARGLYSNVPVSFKPVFKLVVHSNYPVGAAHDDTGLMRRLRVVPFAAKPAVEDPTFKNVLETDPQARSAMLNWLQAGFRAWYDSGFDLGESDVIHEATSGYWGQQNPYEQFAENLKFGPGLKVSSARLGAAFERWSADNNIQRRVAISGLHTYLKSRGCLPTRDSQTRSWEGVALA